MTWYRKNDAKDGDLREVWRFPLFPKRIGNEVRWMEWVYVKQRCEIGYATMGCVVWHDVAFIKPIPAEV